MEFLKLSDLRAGSETETLEKSDEKSFIMYGTIVLFMINNVIRNMLLLKWLELVLRNTAWLPPPLSMCPPCS